MRRGADVADRAERAERGGERDRAGGGRFFQRRRVCRFCADKVGIDYKDAALLRNYLTERGKIIPRRISGNCARHQRLVTTSIKRARTVALLPFTEEH